MGIGGLEHQRYLSIGTECWAPLGLESGVECLANKNPDVQLLVSCWKVLPDEAQGSDILRYMYLVQSISDANPIWGLHRLKRVQGRVDPFWS